MSTTTFGPFRGFDPIKGTVPDYPIYYLPIIANRARDILAKRTSAEVVSAALVVDWIIDEHLPRVYSPEESTSGIYVLKEHISDFELDDENFKDGKYSEYFAVHSLMCLSEAIYWLERTTLIGAGDTSNIESAEMTVAFAGNAALESFDCVFHAREMQLATATFTLVREVTEEAVNKRISLQNSKAAIHSHAKSNEVKAYALSLYEAKDRASPNIAATNLLNSIKEHADKVGWKYKGKKQLRRTISDWFRAIDKSKGLR